MYRTDRNKKEWVTVSLRGPSPRAEGEPSSAYGELEGVWNNNVGTRLHSEDCRAPTC